MEDTVVVNKVTAEAVAATPVCAWFTVASKLVIFVELAPLNPTAVDRLETAVALAATLVSTTATQAEPLYLYCLLESSVSNHKSPSFCPVG